MQYLHADSSTPVIRELVHQVDEDRCILRWLWPDGIQAVYIHRVASDQEVLEQPAIDSLKLYTRDEYKANNGYHERAQGIGGWVYTVFACWLDNDESVLILQEDGQNRKVVSTGRARIIYSIKQKQRLFQKYKTIQMRVTTEVPISKDVICYVKKQGSYPSNKSDGTVYPFVQHFNPGRNVLPEIEVGKNDFIRLFFTDGPKYGQLYELMPE
ncbi:beta-mannanase [Paenibacillus sp. FA6]|uniref:beta-mannanase n=1 Tax=Paenibacillus sp. FA6 TaxID=3413029 RepID=UPI003F658D8B